MPNLWHAISNSEDVVILERGSEHIEIEKPQDPRAQEFFLTLVPGATASEIGVDLLMRHKRSPATREESSAGVIARTA
jgi:hypothetical protein